MKSCTEVRDDDLATESGSDERERERKLFRTSIIFKVK